MPESDLSAAVEAQILQLAALKTLLMSRKGGLKDDGAKRFDSLILALRSEATGAVTEGERAALLSKVQGLATGLPLLTGGIIDVIRANQSGDPFAISGSVLDLTGSLVSTVGAVAGPPGAAVGAVLQGLLSLVSLILQQFMESPPPLVTQIANVLRNIQAETTRQDLDTAAGAISSFVKAAQNSTERDLTVAAIQGKMNHYEGNTIKSIRLAFSWLSEQANQELSGWGEVLALACQLYFGYKLGMAHWLPHMEASEAVKQVRTFDDNDDWFLDKLERLKLAARNRGIIWHVGVYQGKPSSIYVRDVVHPVARNTWKRIACELAVFTVSNRGSDNGPYPYLSIFHLEPGQSYSMNPLGDLKYGALLADDLMKQRGKNGYYAYSDLILETFIKKNRAYDLDGPWPLDSYSGWQTLTELSNCYDIWAIAGRTAGEIDLYTANGDRIDRYIHNKGGKQHLAHDWNTQRVDGYKVVIVRAVNQPRPLVGDDMKVLSDVDCAVYGLCQVRDGKSVIKATDKFEIQADFSSCKGNILLPALDDGPQDWRNYPRGMAVDSLRLWVFGSGFIACVTHAAVKRCVEAKQSRPAWMTYTMPSEVADYDPRQRVYHGLRDLSPCDDGTLTIVFKDRPGRTAGDPGLIFTATARFTKDTFTIVPREVKDNRGNTTEIPGWIRMAGVEAYRVHKQPIFCWPTLEALSDLLQANKSVARIKKVQARATDAPPSPLPVEEGLQGAAVTARLQLPQSSGTQMNAEPAGNTNNT